MTPEIPALYEVAKEVCHSFGLPWTDPRTGRTFRPPKVKIMKKVYKAQWPLATNLETPMVLIYPASSSRQERYYMPATPALRKAMFQGKYVRVFFVGSIDEKTGTVAVDKFVRQNEWQ